MDYYYYSYVLHNIVYVYYMHMCVTQCKCRDKTGITYVLPMEYSWYHLPYGGKLWQGETLANRPWFTKLKPSKLVLIINLLAVLLICKMLETKSIRQISPPPTARLSLHTAYYKGMYYSVLAYQLHLAVMFMLIKQRIILCSCCTFPLRLIFKILFENIYQMIECSFEC